MVLRFALALSIATATAAARADDLPALRVSGSRLVDEKGAPVQLRGANMGCWLLLEPHFLGMSFRDEQSLWAGLGQRVGRDKAAEIREALREAWITAEDFKNVRKLGLNHVRVPFPDTLLESDDKPGVYKEEGWKWLDNSVKWSEEAGIYCVLDLHGAPGGQSTAEHTGARDRNELWTKPANVRRTVKLWQAVAKRYKGRKSIAAFDLLNEPMGAPDAKAMLAVQFECFRAVRAVDPQRLCVVEDGYKGIESFQPPAARDKPGLIYSVHVYPTIVEANPTPEHHERYFREQVPRMLTQQRRLAQPLYIGEWNVVQESAGGAPMIRRHVEAMDQAGWSWALWIYKQANPAGVRGVWSLYRNPRKLDLPDFDHDDGDAILTKIRTQMSPEHFELYEPVAQALAEK